MSWRRGAGGGGGGGGDGAAAGRSKRRPMVGERSLTIERFAHGKDGQTMAYMKKKQAIKRSIYQKQSLHRKYQKVLKREGMHTGTNPPAKSGGGTDDDEEDNAGGGGGGGSGNGSGSGDYANEESNHRPRSTARGSERDDVDNEPLLGDEAIIGRGPRSRSQAHKKSKKRPRGWESTQLEEGEGGVGVNEEEGSRQGRQRVESNGGRNAGDGGRKGQGGKGDEGVDGGEGQRQQRHKREKRPDRFLQAKKEAAEKKEKSEAIEKDKKEKARLKDEREKERKINRILLSKRTKRGQPVMKNTINVLLQKLQKGKEH